jgi:hypothetical protein
MRSWVTQRYGLDNITIYFHLSVKCVPIEAGVLLHRNMTGFVWSDCVFCFNIAYDLVSIYPWLTVLTCPWWVRPYTKISTTMIQHDVSRVGKTSNYWSTFIFVNLPTSYTYLCPIYWRTDGNYCIIHTLPFLLCCIMCQYSAWLYSCFCSTCTLLVICVCFILSPSCKISV